MQWTQPPPPPPQKSFLMFSCAPPRCSATGGPGENFASQGLYQTIHEAKLEPPFYPAHTAWLLDYFTLYFFKRKCSRTGPEKWKRMEKVFWCVLCGLLGSVLCSFDGSSKDPRLKLKRVHVQTWPRKIEEANLFDETRTQRKCGRTWPENQLNFAIEKYSETKNDSYGITCHQLPQAPTVGSWAVSPGQEMSQCLVANLFVCSFGWLLTWFVCRFFPGLKLWGNGPRSVASSPPPNPNSSSKPPRKPPVWKQQNHSTNQTKPTNQGSRARKMISLSKKTTTLRTPLQPPAMEVPRYPQGEAFAMGCQPQALLALMSFV